MSLVGGPREEALSEIVAICQRIASGRAETLADAAVQLRRLVVMAEARTPAARLARRSRCAKPGRVRRSSGLGHTVGIMLPLSEVKRPLETRGLRV